MTDKVTSGRSLMQYLIHRFHERLYHYMDHAGESLRAPDGKKYYPVFRWEGNDLIIDNTDTFLAESGDRKRPRVYFGSKLVKKLGLIREESYYSVHLDMNMIKIFPTTRSRLISRKTGPTMTAIDLVNFGVCSPLVRYSSVPIATGASVTWTRNTPRPISAGSSFIRTSLRLGVPCTCIRMWVVAHHGESRDGSLERSTPRLAQDDVRTDSDSI